tara:strand:+ start:115 stop:1005 length:891 start_codon:yes stop_codon:yes gene_type:complete
MFLVIMNLRNCAELACRLVRRPVCAALLAACVSGLPLQFPQAAAQETGKAPTEVDFMGHPITPDRGVYVVTKDLNVRDAPETAGKKVGSFQEGERIDVVGKAKGSWMAVNAEGKNLGFVYGPVLMPLIDAVLREPLVGAVSIKGGSCAYRMVFEGESPIEGQMFNSIDYRTVLECQRSGRSYAFEMPLFITEGPYNGGTRSIYQIGMDVLELAQEYERVFSTNLLFDAEKGQVRLDSVSVDKYLDTDDKTAKPKKAADRVETVAGALAAALDIAVQGWSSSFWRDLGKALGAPSGG